ncbi:MAG TPA: patatin-like phospholipase family protein [Terriglobales bacterium]|nr:patatin-like phospholipase family protein [Terriglobales bacterium]
MPKPEPAPADLASVLAQEHAALRPDEPHPATSLTDLHARALQFRRPLSALCFSGGGIRSATLNLGVLQGLAERGLLAGFDYLSTVSGGGYIGAWLTAWSSRVGGLANVVPWLRPNAPPPGDGTDPVGHLRAYNNYLTPRLGALSLDAWTVAATVLRNVFLNWLIFIPLLLFALMFPRLLLSLAEAGAVAPPPLAEAALPWLAGALFAFGLGAMLFFLPSLGGVNHTRARFLALALAPLAVATVTWCGYDALHTSAVHWTAWPLARTLGFATLPGTAAAAVYLAPVGRPRSRPPFALLGAVVLLGAGTGMALWLLHQQLLVRLSWPGFVTLAPAWLWFGFSLAGALFVGCANRTLRTLDREWAARAAACLLLLSALWIVANAAVLLAPTWIEGLGRWLAAALAGIAGLSGWLSAFGDFRGLATAADASKRAHDLLVRLAAVVFLALLAVGLALLTDGLLAASGFVAAPWNQHARVLLQSPGWAILLAAALFLVLGEGMGRFININKFSLEGMYRGRLIRAYLGASNPKSELNHFTGFSATDDLPLHTLQNSRPLPVLNLTLNLVGAPRLAWQQRKAEPFTATPFACGNPRLGFRPAADYGGHGGLTLGTAVAISGAAANPNMGYYSSPLLGFIMTLLNVRLGVWLGNPAAPRKFWRRAGPRSAAGWLLREALGQTSDRSAYINLSDGGHFEDLGLYEMVRRRCRRIVVVDAGCDPDFRFQDLGNALRKIRIDLGISIAFEDGDLEELRSRRRRCAVAAIQYSPTESGELLYLKPVLLGTESPDVASYAAAHPAFPHQSTADQWFSESQTESYRMLGLQTIQEIAQQPVLAALLGPPPETASARA